MTLRLNEPFRWGGMSASPKKAVNGGGWLSAYNAGGVNVSSLALDPQDKAAKLLGAFKVGWFNKAERKISTDFAGLSVSVAPEDDSGDNEADIIEPDLSTPWAQLDPVGRFLRLMEKPNPYQTGRQLRQKTMIRMDMAGWTWWYTELDSDGLIAENGIYGISPTRLWPSYNKTTGQLIGYVLDKNNPSGPTMTFEVDEIVPFSYGSADDDAYGVGVVEAVWAQQPLTELMARHTADLLTTGGRMAGMMWPKERSLDEAEFQDAQRAWRSVVSDPNAARRLLLFPEPMEWQNGASTPDEIGIPELATLNRDEILTAFPISPYMLGTPFAGGLNESGASRREEKASYWEETIHPRVELFEETIQTYIIPRYEAAIGSTLDFEVEEPNLDDATKIIEKVGALKALIEEGFDDKEAVAAVGLEHIKYLGPPTPVAPVLPPQAVITSNVRDTTPSDASQTRVTVSKSLKVARVEQERDAALDGLLPGAKSRLVKFFDEQRARVEAGWRALPSTKAERRMAVKADPDWWDAKAEDDRLTEVLRGVYLDIGRSGLQAVADSLDRIVPNRFVGNVMTDLLEYGGQRIKDINANTLQALTIQLAEGTRRGYSIAQLVDGVPDEGYTGIAGVTLDNGTLAFDPYRAEMIARTESMLSYNRATVTGYGEFGIQKLLAYDGDQDEQCAPRNGNEFTILEAQTITDHPNGTLVWSPIVDKSYHDEALAIRDDWREMTEKFLEAVKSIAQPTPVYITLPSPPGITVNTPDVNVTTPDVHVDVNVPEQDVPVVNVTTPDVTVNVPEQSSNVNVIVPDQPAPIVNVESPTIQVQPADPTAPVVHVHVPEPKPVKRKVVRDKQGVITHIEES